MPTKFEDYDQRRSRPFLINDNHQSVIEPPITKFNVYVDGKMRKVVQRSMFDYQCSIINGPFLIINIYQLVIDDDGCSMQDTAEAERARRGGVDGLQTTLKTSDH